LKNFARFYGTSSHHIIEGAKDKTGFDLPVQDIYCALSPEEQAQTVISTDAGGYVCNETAYWLISHFLSKPVAYTFIHVPNNNFTQPSDLPRNSGILRKMLDAAIKSSLDHALSTPLTPAELACGQRPRLPVSLEVVAGAMKTLNQFKDPAQVACFKRFLSQLQFQ